MTQYNGVSVQKNGDRHSYAARADKMRELVLYVVNRCENDSRLGATKLNKILFYADFLAYVNLGKSITNYEYRALPQGPVPTKLLPLRNSMVDEGDLLFYEREYHGKKQHRFAALRNANLAVFNASEIALVDAVIEKLWGQSAKAVSQLSHQFIGWHFADEKSQELIPYEVALVGNRSLTIGEIKKGMELEELAERVLVR